MRRGKADRFERMVRKLTSDDQSCGLTEVLLAEEAIHLLRREHRAVMRMVNNCVPNKAWSAVASLGYGQAVMDILNLLEARAR